jgi:hypothetical protein
MFFTVGAGDICHLGNRRIDSGIFHLLLEYYHCTGQARHRVKSVDRHSWQQSRDVPVLKYHSISPKQFDETEIYSQKFRRNGMAKKLISLEHIKIV